MISSHTLCDKLIRKIIRFGTTFQRNRVPNHVFRDNFSDFRSGIIAGRPKMWSAIIVKSVSHFPNHSFGIFPTHRDHAETPTSDPASQVSSQVSSIKLHSTSALHTGILVKGMFFQFVAWSAPLLSLLVSVVCIYVKSWSSPLSPHQ